MTFSNLSISKRLSLAFGFLILMLVDAVGLGLYDLREIDHHIEDIVNDNNTKLRLVHEMSESAHIAARISRTIVLLDDDAASDRELHRRSHSAPSAGQYAIRVQ
jgi:methyl-accepting chemotaxis protein